ncbi:uncharacterized protein EV154DRAFT_470209 [Mucor mucedo]|uniref:uncharacterized protein n=1 Tax=Mucor mucedo TaxID=29922 RepID=UPI0022211822|nr:uncharacterized protein EV154DRAFT_470209 [Mucor mucedo]KAI7887606.1 hypothetical protein EV154DRAFT_470209 [Mucor mucedo]
MLLSNNLIVASLFVIASSWVNAAVTSPLTVVNSQDDFCLFLPPKPGLVVAVNENNGVAFCTKKDLVSKASEFPSGFITTAHYLKSSKYVQVTGFFDRSKYSLGESDGGGQYDNHGKGKPVAAMCKGYNYFVSLIEPDIERFCIRCCQDKVDCNTGRSGYGCLRVVSGDYTRDNNFGSTNNKTKSTHQNTNMDSVLSDLNELPVSDSSATAPVATAAAATTTTTTTNANEEIAAEIDTLKQDLAASQTPVDQIQTKWNTFATQLSTDYPQVASQITQLSSITSTLTTPEQWNTFIELVSETIAQISTTSTTTESGTTTHTDSQADLDWLFEHRNSHNNQATW